MDGWIYGWMVGKSPYQILWKEVLRGEAEDHTGHLFL